jgi:hypothetical protein
MLGLLTPANLIKNRRFEWLADAGLPRQQICPNTLPKFSARVQQQMGVPVVRFHLLKQPSVLVFLRIAL